MREQDDVDFEIKLLLEAIYHKYRSDFRNYSVASMRRRLLLAIQRLGFASVSQLQDALLSQPALYDKLLPYLTVPTSEMFRDPSYFACLRSEVLPILATYPSLKIWIAGCSTGEELWSVAIMLKEENLLHRSVIYATDINPRSLQAAESGIFSLEEMSKFTRNYQAAGGKNAFSSYYEVKGDRAVFHPALKTNVVFADHSLATDSVFAEVQLISCRNVMIYFNRELQDRTFNLFRDSLAYRGFLGIGSKESIRFSAAASDFDDFSAREKIYRKKAVLR
jgi:chemotaxis protein methyltransferase CheR